MNPVIMATESSFIYFGAGNTGRILRQRGQIRERESERVNSLRIESVRGSLTKREREKERRK